MEALGNANVRNVSHIVFWCVFVFINKVLTLRIQHCSSSSLLSVSVKRAEVWSFSPKRSRCFVGNQKAECSASWWAAFTDSCFEALLDLLALSPSLSYLITLITLRSASPLERIQFIAVNFSAPGSSMMIYETVAVLERLLLNVLFMTELGRLYCCGS